MAESSPDGTSTTESDATELHHAMIMKEEFDTLVDKYDHRGELPPFTATEVIVMAVLGSGTSKLKMGAILEWISWSFKYYRRSARRASHGTNVNRHRRPEGSPAEGWSQIADALDCWEFPFSHVKRNQSFSSIAELCATEVSVCRAAGRGYLCYWLQPDGNCPPGGFLRLPPELRNTI
jgi:hypothetical protein